MHMLLALAALAVARAEVEVLTEATFAPTTAAALRGGRRCFVKFYAPWCGHCKKLEPVWADLAAQAGADVLVAKVDATQHPRLAKTYGVKGYPTLVFLAGHQMQTYKGGRKLDELVAYVTEGYKSGENAQAAPTPPGPPTALEELLGKSALGKDFRNIVKFEKGAAGVLFGLGVAVGLLVAALVSCCCCPRPSKVKGA